MDKKLEELIFAFGAVARLMSVGDNMRDAASFKALASHITDLLTEATQRGVQIERKRWKRCLNAEYGFGPCAGDNPSGDLDRYERTLALIEHAADDIKLDKPVLDCIEKSQKGADPERSGFALEMATQYGFTYIDDDAEILGVTAKRLTDMMSVLGFRTSSEYRAARAAAVGGEIGSDGKQVASAVQVRVANGYSKLFNVLTEALDQAQAGKGAERHNLGGDVPFERQRMQTVSELVGSPDGMVYQAIKKLTEGMELPTLDRQVKELLGAINYIAGIILFLRKQANDEAFREVAKTWNETCRRWDGRPIIHHPTPAGQTNKTGNDVHKLDGQEFGGNACVTDPVKRIYPIIPSTGWTADSVSDLFAVLAKLSRQLGSYSGTAEDIQLLARVWRLDSPILKAIDGYAPLINEKAADFVAADRMKPKAGL